MKILALAFGLIVAAAKGCGDTNSIGVQDYGSITGRVINGKTQVPVSTALVSVGSTIAQYTDPQGAFTVRVPTGTQTLVVRASGYGDSSQQVTVLKDQTTQLNYVQLTPLE